MMQRLIIQMAHGVDTSGTDPQAAAEEAVRRALSQVSLPAPEVLGFTADQMRKQVHVAVPDPEQLDKAALACLCGGGKVSVDLVKGGLFVRDATSDASQIMATVAVEVFLPKATGWRRKRG